MCIAVDTMERTVDICGVEIRTQIVFQQIELLVCAYKTRHSSVSGSSTISGTAIVRDSRGNIFAHQRDDCDDA